LSELEEAWNTAVGEPHCHQTRVGKVRRGILNVMVAHPTLLEELAAFRKPALLQALRAGVAGTTIHDIQFRVGPIEEPEATKVEPLPPLSSALSPLKQSKARLGAASKGQRSGRRTDNHDRTGGED